ncbi:MAG: hypothetical protein ACI9MB_002755, partial [Verrucomicrobiales bacterium]
ATKTAGILSSSSPHEVFGGARKFDFKIEVKLRRWLALTNPG